MRNVRREVFSTVAALALPLGVVAIFPYRAIGFKPSSDVVERRPFAAFVTLTEDEERRATVAVKTTWQGDAGGIRRLRADLSVGELPEDSHGSILEISPHDLRVPESAVGFARPSFPPSMKAPAPEKIPPLPALPDEVPFSKAELLKID